MLRMPSPEAIPSPTGLVVEVAPIADERSGSILGEIDGRKIDSGPDLLAYVSDELVNSLSRLGFAVRHVEGDYNGGSNKRLLVSLLSAEISSESSLMYPVVAVIRLRTELLDESGQSTFRREIRGAASRRLGFHTQGGPEDAQLLAEAVDQAFSRLATDQSFSSAVNISPQEAAKQAGSPITNSEQTARGAERGEEAAAVADRLGVIDRLLEEGLINHDDYDLKRREILDDL